MLPPNVAAIVGRIIVAVSAGDYAAALAEVGATRCSAQQRAITARSAVDRRGLERALRIVASAL